MSIHQRLFSLFIVPLLAFFWTYKKKPIIPPQAHLPPTEESAGPLEQMFQNIPCEEGQGTWYEILDEKGISKICVAPPSAVEI